MAPQTIAAIIDAEAAKIRGTGQWDANSKASTSSATGLTQFLDATWRGEAQRSGGILNMEAKELGVVNASNQIVDKARLLKMRFDPRLAILAGADYAKRNLSIMRQAGVLPERVDPAGMAKLAYLAHHEGPQGAVRCLKGDMGYVTDKLFAANVVDAARRTRYINAAGGDKGLGYRRWLTEYIDGNIDVTKFMVSTAGVTVPKLQSFFR
jgi:hypothetical protein